MKDYEEKESIWDCIAELSDLGNAFAAVGNTFVARRLIEIAARLQIVSEQHTSDIGEITSKYLQHSWQGSDNMLMASLAGLAIGDPKLKDVIATLISRVPQDAND